MPIGAGSSADSARPSLPTTLATSGTLAMARSCWRVHLDRLRRARPRQQRRHVEERALVERRHELPADAGEDAVSLTTRAGAARSLRDCRPCVEPSARAPSASGVDPAPRRGVTATGAPKIREPLDRLERRADAEPDVRPRTGSRSERRGTALVVQHPAQRRACRRRRWRARRGSAPAAAAARGPCGTTPAATMTPTAIAVGQPLSVRPARAPHMNTAWAANIASEADAHRRGAATGRRDQRTGLSR